MVVGEFWEGCRGVSGGFSGVGSSRGLRQLTARREELAEEQDRWVEQVSGKAQAAARPIPARPSPRPVAKRRLRMRASTHPPPGSDPRPIG